MQQNHIECSENRRIINELFKDFMRRPLRYILFLGTVFCFGFQACTTGGGSDETTSKSVAKPVEPQSFSYSVYLENSGSLNGYLAVSGPGSFRDAIYSLLTGINGFPEKRALNLYDINTQVIPVARNASASALDQYISNLDAAQFAKRSQANGGDQSKSDIRLVLKKVLDSTGSEKIALLISDFIFSPGKNADALDYLSQQKAGIQGYFQEHLAQDSLSALLLQFTSDFEGAYYDQSNTAHPGRYSQRPYYVLCLGQEKALRNLLDYVDQHFADKGYRHFLFFTPTKNYDVHPTIRLNTAYYDYQPDEPLQVSHGQKGGADSRFRVFVKVNYSALPLSEDEKTNPDNYELSPGFQIQEVKALPESASGFTHELTIVAEKVIKGNLQVSMKKEMPSWIASSDLKSDKGLSPEELEGKTFGISSLTQGMFDAYFGRDAKPRFYRFGIDIKD